MNGNDSAVFIPSSEQKDYKSCGKTVGSGAGTAVRLGNTPLYSFSKAQRPSVYVNGTYYLYDGRLINGRYRVTDKKSKANKKPLFFYAAGWIDGDAVL
jgi:hypothetical protein